MSSPRDAAVRQAERRLVLGNTQSHVLRFAEHDTDGNQELDFDEFYAMQPKHLLETFSTEQIRRGLVDGALRAVDGCAANLLRRWGGGGREAQASRREDAWSGLGGDVGGKQPSVLGVLGGEHGGFVAAILCRVCVIEP